MSTTELEPGDEATPQLCAWTASIVSNYLVAFESSGGRATTFRLGDRLTVPVAVQNALTAAVKLSPVQKQVRE